MNDFHFDRNAIRKNTDDFIELYGAKDLKINARAIHTRNVAQTCEAIALGLGMTGYDVDLAWTIGYLHDFARFGQIRLTDSVKDTKKFDHARFGARLLFTHGLINDIIPNFGKMPTEDMRVIELAILYHSALDIPDDLTEREAIYCNLIRDADKIDIFRVIVTEPYEEIYGVSREELQASSFSPEITAAFDKRTTAEFRLVKTVGDLRLVHIAMAFGMYFEPSKKAITEQGYLEKMLTLDYTDPETQKTYERLRNIVRSFLKNEK